MFQETGEYRRFLDALNDTFAYDNASRLTQANNGRYNNLVTRAYDAGGRMTSEALTVNGQTYPVASGYDAADRRTSITYPNGKIVAQTFTNRDQLLNVKYDAVNVATFAYDLGGRKTTNTFGNSKVETRTYRTDNRTNTIVTPTGITNFAYGWDVNKNKTQENDTALPTNGQDYSYDNEDRLTGFARNSGQTQAWTLSLVGDWSAFNDNGSSQTRTHNSVHELTAVNSTSLTYDLKGNLTTNSNAQTYTWDFENCMKTAVVGADTATYQYDAFRRRVTKNFQGTTMVFVYDGWRSVAEYENGAALTAPARVYVFGTYLDEALMMLAGSTKYYYHANELYSVAALTNSAGTVVERYKHDPYGKVSVLDASGTAKSDPNNSEYGNPFTYTGQRLDKETNLLYYKNRYYSADLGRFISRDPIGYKGSHNGNLYEYEGATIFTDKLGQEGDKPDTKKCEKVKPKCGPDITVALVELKTEVENFYANTKWKNKKYACQRVLATDSWDIFELWSNRVEDKDCGSCKGKDPSGDIFNKTVEVSGVCMLTSEANYYLFGIISKICEDEWTAGGDPVPVGEGFGWAYVRNWKLFAYRHLPTDNDFFAWKSGRDRLPAKAPSGFDCDTCGKSWNGKFHWKWAGLKKRF